VSRAGYSTPVTLGFAVRAEMLARAVEPEDRLRSARRGGALGAGRYEVVATSPDEI
jgi:hypothetical protein